MPENALSGQVPPTVSVVIPAYNQGRYLSLAIQSVLSQSFRDFEIIVVDDGSTDQTSKAARQFGNSIVYVRQENHGLARARNRGLQEARGEYIAFLDADDAWYPDYLGAMISLLAKSVDAVAAFAAWKYVDQEGRELPQTIIPFAGDGDIAAEQLDWRNSIVPSGAVVRRSAIESCGGVDPQLSGCEDWDLWLRLRPLGGFLIEPRALVYYRTHSDNMSDDIEAMEAERLKVHRKHLGGLDSPFFDWSFAKRRAIGNTFFVSALGYFRQGERSQAIEKISQALCIWPELIEEDEFYYELGCAYQKRGYRGTPIGLDLAQSADLLRSLLQTDLNLPDGERPPLWGRASLVLARLALIAGDRPAARQYALLAIWRAPARQKLSAIRAFARATIPSALVRLFRRTRRGFVPGLPSAS